MRVYDARHVQRVDVSVAQMYVDCSHHFPKCLPRIPVLSVGGLLSSSSYCLVPMSCETGSCQTTDLTIPSDIRGLFPPRPVLESDIQKRSPKV